MLIDGRTVYSPLYSGVFWDMQNVVSSDIERIEVVSGPGGALWGSNAVNGVINVVSRSSADTPGGMVRFSGGNADWSGMAKVGGALSERGTYRVYGQASRQGHTDTPLGLSGADYLTLYQGGARTDWNFENASLMVQGDYYEGVNRPSSVAKVDLRGGNVLGRWHGEISDTSNVEIQAYYDHAARAIDNGIHDGINTYDISAQHSFMLGDRQHITWGGGYRITDDIFVGGPLTSVLSPAQRTLQLANVFAHDTIALTSALKLALGLKLERNAYTGWEYMPDARLSWQVAPSTMLWAAVSRAARTPSRFDRDLFNTVLAGGPTFHSEELIAYEAGYRGRLADNATLSVSLFYNDYEDLRTVEPPFPLTIQNLMDGYTYGIESWATYEPLSWWRLKAGVTAIGKHLRLKPGSASFFGTQNEGNDPDHQFSLRSEMSLTQEVELDLAMRAIGALPSPAVPSYIALDARLGWNVTEHVQLSLSGYNLLDAHHTEFIVASPPQRAVRRSVYATARWSF